ncbi:Serine phosphatase RsbU, regulator of sigma subunit [Lentimonas sp. CC19]|nr:Serine phosphatase RsbU, regulator of sigma subunit [Lentimonas sp. CC4]CAA6684646.1 Serine phosphatase RsbU, regulator of sigma subunit [Lentimonas sp. CC6]CAA6694185.1 Serine phosphatase RsbU, regulator of sigma subunit [Lentimonas sp. CC19]CAA6694319.1 Serine phosphatase RsbU, regulator of sigma subunit [Lentimonas sp. CC10]CAA7070386.1 Serine phosphatase RsbU, regulator of sigma subunit [Lentimonas sp. CC11]CAA7170667.1 Serine phosphatase RsbU, regulator of sigma subunit [Lentimonas sp.
MWLLHTGRRRHIKIIEDEKQLLQQEKQIVVEFMHNMVEAVAEGSDRAAMFQRIIHAAILSTGAMSACIFEKREDDTLKGIAVEGLFPPQRKLPEGISAKLATRAQFLENILKSESFKMGEGLIGQAAKSKRAQLIVDATNDPRVIQHSDPALQVRSIIIAPVLFQGELIAVLAVANPADDLAFTDTDFSLVESLAEQVGLAVHNSDAMQLQIEKNKLDLDIELASNIQGLLLPSKFPASDKIEFSAHYTPAQKIGGDLYDVFAIDDNRIGVAIADVSGKGISASILMAICQTNLRHVSRQLDSPAEVLIEINSQMQSSMRRDMFITIVYAIIDQAKQEITFARAGHELPFVYRHASDGTESVEAVQSQGMALGMVPPEIFDLTIKDKTVPFGKDDALLLYTDGVTESVNASGDEYSGERLIETLKAHGNSNAQSILNHVMDSVHRFSGDEGQPDDLTLIAIKHS